MNRFFGCVPAITVPNHDRSAVKKADRFEPELNATFRDMARHYGTVIMPARVRKPRDKATVENAVLQMQRWVLGRLRNHVFHSSIWSCKQRTEPGFNIFLIVLF